MKTCPNPRCDNFNKIIPGIGNQCPSCGSNLIITDEPPPGSRPAAGLVGGVLFGWAVGGPVGAVLGGLVGGILGASVEEEEKRKKELDKLW